MSGHPRTHQNAILRTYAGLLLISICVYTLMYAPQPMFNSVSRDFGVDKGSTGLLVSVFMLSLAVSPLCVGMLLSRIGVRRAILGASLLLGISGVGIWFAPSFLVLLGIRALQALLVPVVLTAVMSGIAVMFRHLDLNRALAGYVTSNLVGSLCGRIIGGWAAQMFGWRATLAVICFFFFLVLLFIRSIPEMRNASARLHSPREYLAVFKGRGVPSLFFAEACGIFVFAAIGNLIPFRMAELGQGHNLFTLTAGLTFNIGKVGSSDSCISGIPSALSLRCPLRRSCACLRRQQGLFFSRPPSMSPPVSRLRSLPFGPCSAGYGS